MKLGLQEIDWAYVGACLANEDDNNQEKFFKSFVKECLSWGTNFQAQEQLAFVNHKLTSEERDLLGMLSFNEKE